MFNNVDAIRIRAGIHIDLLRAARNISISTSTSISYISKKSNNVKELKISYSSLLTVAKAIFENLEVLSSLMEPISIGTMGTQKPYRFSFEQYVQEARTKMPTRKAAGWHIIQI